MTNDSGSLVQRVFNEKLTKGRRLSRYSLPVALSWFRYDKNDGMSDVKAEAKTETKESFQSFSGLGWESNSDKL